MDINKVTAKDIDLDVLDSIHSMFGYHAWTEDQQKASAHIREACAKLVGTIVQFAPPSPDRSVAIRKIREACMDANQAITFGAK